MRHLHVTPLAFLPMRSMPSRTLVAGLGIEGDRYRIGRESGFYSHKPEAGRQVTLFITCVAACAGGTLVLDL